MKNKLINKYPDILLVFLFACIAYAPIFFISTPLWDDYTLSGSSFEDLSKLFKDVGVYNMGMAHYYHAINLLNADSVVFGRLVSFIALSITPVLFYIILYKAGISDLQIKITCFLFIVLPFFGACFTQIVLFYIICLDLFLFSIFFLINYIKIDRKKDLAFYAFFLWLSYLLNSLIFFVLPFTLLIWFLIVKNFKISKKLIIVFTVTTSTIIVYMLFKHFFMQVNPNSSYVNYNKITLQGLLFSGPQKAILQMPQIFLNLFYLTLDVLMQQVNLLFALVLAIPFYFTFKRMEWKTISFKHFMLAIVASIILIFSALYPYAVVGKVNNNMYEYTSRFDMLLVVGVSIMITSMILFLFKNQYAGKIFLSFTFSILFICKLCIFINFYYHSSLQNSFCNSYLSKLDSTKSHVIHEQKKHTVNWRFYEIGGILRAQHMTENIFFVSGKSPLLVNDTINKILVHDKVIINHYSIKDFDINNYDYKTVELNYKEKLNILDFFKLFLGLQPLDFTVKESKNNID